ncbi:MAG: ankyrin repeat domain-containing protein [Fimbriimonas sp.]|nr:ankyrin repeat domain-containing protein [Fimbriimonas sp.]
MNTKETSLWTLLHARAWGDVRRIIEQNPDSVDLLDHSGGTTSIYLAFNGQLELAHLAADRRSDLTMAECAVLGRWKSLGVAIARNPGQVSDLSPEGFSPLHLAGAFRSYDCAALLIANGANLNVKANSSIARNSPLGATAFGGDSKIIELLLCAGADPNVADDGGFTPLHLAADSGNLEIAELLVRFGADRMAIANGKSAAEFAAAKGHSELASFLRY